MSTVNPKGLLFIFLKLISNNCVHYSHLANSFLQSNLQYTYYKNNPPKG